MRVSRKVVSLPEMLSAHACDLFSSPSQACSASARKWMDPLTASV